MGQPGKDTFKGIQKTLEPYIRPREEVARIRQILAAHLDSCITDGAAVGPLALVDTNRIGSSSTARGLQKEYLDALSANIKARDEFAACCREQRRPEEKATSADDQGVNRLQEHLATIRLRQRRERMQVIERGLNSLGQKPAASPSFLDPGEIFRDSRPLPDVPKELVTALTVDKAAAGPRLKDLIDELEKHVLQTKLLLKREEQLLEKVRSRSTAKPDNISESAKLEALNRTRGELINWIESELGKAAGEDGDVEAQDSQKHRSYAESLNMEEQLASIKEKYAQYLEARKTLLQLVSQQPQPIIKPPATEAKAPAPAAPKQPPTAHLLSPYLEQLLSISREQKGLIAQKSHLNGAVSKQLKENSQVLDHLAEESQLIPAHPMPGAPRPSAAFADAMSSTDSSGPSNRVRPWVFAADSAKISTLEAVAEKIEEGQIALEGSMRTLGEIEQLLGQPPESQEKEERDSTGEDDLWLAEGQPSGKTTGARKHTSQTADRPAQAKTAWDMLDGNLGLLRAEKDAL
ncbi:hypothetical protein C8A01DRAFT_14255 [Parachaetomium inaequale]|uniref:Uncharacterized protein n=1 Tax=Parachaetomium inaequale TaxID=2588326 RepID=A0AAN6ST23_9PEZI|nr:hypothetical protein C8A01DRAFT_14255 [Parachaetomium inaequale]